MRTSRAAPIYLTVDINQIDYEDESAKDHDVEVLVYIREVENTPGFELPSTGGPGTTLFAVSGLSLVLLALALLFRKKQQY